MVLERFPSVQLVRNTENTGFAKAANQGAALGAGRYLLFLNSDAQLLPESLARMLALAEVQPRVALVGPQLCNPDGSFQAAYASFPTPGREFLVLSGFGRMLYGREYPSHPPQDEKGPQRVDWVSGACVLARRQAFEEVAGFDEGYFMYAEDVDLCYRVQAAGWETWYQPAARVIHVGGASSRSRRTAFERDLYRGRMRFIRTHQGERPARLLYMEIYAFTAIKLLFHGGLRWLTHGRYGRPVTDLRSLMSIRRAELMNFMRPPNTSRKGTN